MGVQDRKYLKERPMHDVALPSPSTEVTASQQAVELADSKRQIEKLSKDAKEAAKRISLLTKKIENMHKAALTRPDVAEMVVAIEHSLISLCELQVSDERSRQILCGVHQLLQTARLNQGAASELPAARIGWEAALAAYYESCSRRELDVVERFLPLH